MSVRRAASLPALSVHLRIVPRPANLSESREVFRVLQRFGEISMFKYLRYEYHNPADNIALAIFRDSTSAQKALDASPLRFALTKEVHQLDDAEALSPTSDPDDNEPSLASTAPINSSIDEILRPSTLSTRTSPSLSLRPTPPTPQPPMPFDPPLPPPNTPRPFTKTKWFQVTVDRSRAVHQDFVERQPYWKQFAPMKSMAQEDLAKRVPHIGLSDVSKRPPHAHRTPNRVLRMMSEYVEGRMPSLRGLVEGRSGEVEWEKRQR